jgi:O-acetyl-ADP-ribose deacetylase (regulator of RNase III)
MSKEFFNGRIQIVIGDITTLHVDAIVNAANTTLLGGGGVDGAIHRAAGGQLLEECKTLNGCKTGEAKITQGYNLPAKHVIHTVGPVWNGGQYNEDALLKNCYVNSLIIASGKKLQSIAFPAISTGVYRFPQKRAAEIAIETVFNFLQKHEIPKQVLFVCFDENTAALYEAGLKHIEVF